MLQRVYHTGTCVYVHTASTKQNNKRTMNQKESKDLIVYTKICSQIDLHKFNLYLCFWWTRSKAMLSPLIEWNSMFLYFFNFYKMNVIQYTIHSFVFGLKRFFIMFLLLFFPAVAAAGECVMYLVTPALFLSRYCRQASNLNKRELCCCQLTRTCVFHVLG